MLIILHYSYIFVVHFGGVPATPVLVRSQIAFYCILQIFQNAIWDLPNLCPTISSCCQNKIKAYRGAKIRFLCLDFKKKY